MQLPGAADIFGTRGLVKVAVTIDGQQFRLLAAPTVLTEPPCGYVAA